MSVRRTFFRRGNFLNPPVVAFIGLLTFAIPAMPLAQDHMPGPADGAMTASGPTIEIQTLFFDDFSAPLNTSLWDYNHFESGGSFYGRTQQRQALPQVSNGMLHLQLDTYNPTGVGNSFLGSEAISTQTFTIDAGGIAFEASARIVSKVPGLVGGFFGYNFNNATRLDSELDTELLGTDAAAGRNRAQTNVYSNEPLGAGHPQFVPVTDLTQFHTYRMEWFPDRVRWLIDNQLVLEDTVHIPHGALALHLNIWVPDKDWSDAYSASLQPAGNAAANVSYDVDVDYVRVARLALYKPILCCKDSNADTKADILWRNSSGVLYQWFMDGTAAIGQGSPGTATSDWTIAGVGDFNGDGKADILWRNTASGAVYQWFMNGTGVIAQASLGIVTSDWQIAGVGDFNGDGKTDILWRNLSGAVYQWFMNGASVIGQATLGNVSTDWTVAALGDLNGDGKTDILWRNTGSGQVYVWLMNGTSVIGQASLGIVTSEWQIAGVGDFNGDGKADILWRNTASGAVYQWFMNGTSVIVQASLGFVTSDWQIAGVGDFNGDGKADILWRNTVSGAVYEWLMNGTTVIGQASLGTVTNDWQIE
jgi:beta-glucanase (GH16 family)